MKSPIKVFHIKDEDKAVVTVATMVVPSTGRTGKPIVHIGFAFCNTKKDSFCRKQGRMLALDRMANTQSSYKTRWSGHSSTDVAMVWPNVMKPTFLQKRDLRCVDGLGLHFFAM
jgi:hypothetical protein